MKENDISKRIKDEKRNRIEDRTKENLFMGRRQTTSFIQRPRTLLKETTNVILDKSKSGTTTPTKSSVRSQFVPVSPTANLKLLTDMASLESSFDDCETKVEIVEVQSGTKTTPGSRKDKSLSLLCKKFLEKYPEYPPDGKELELSLEELSKDLSVERRRIYDIVNVLESVEMMQRVAKNCYKWYGKTNMSTTLARLKFLAHLEKLDKQFVTMQSGGEKVQVVEVDSNDNSREDGSTSSSFLVNEEVLYSRKEKSLGAMSKKFVMLFLVVQPNIISLESAANILLGEPNVDVKSTAYKTKIRRLYDIANILSSLNLIRKVHVSELYGRKPAFEYIGPDLSNVMLDPINAPGETQGFAFPNKSRAIVGNNLKRTLSDVTERGSPSKFQRTKSETCLQTKRQVQTKSLLMRHTSLQDVCDVAEQERSKINAESQSANEVMKKSSPTMTMKMTSSGKPIQVITFASNSISIKQRCSSSAPLHVLKLPLVLRLEKASLPRDTNKTSSTTAEMRSLLVNLDNRASDSNSVEQLGCPSQSVTDLENGSESRSTSLNTSNITVIKYVQSSSSSPQLILNGKDKKPLSLISKNLRMTR